MIRKLIIVLISALPLLTNAQTIHWLTFIDTTDPEVGQIDVNGRKVLYNHFVNVINAALLEKGYKANVQDIYGTTLSPEKCKEVVTNLRVAPNDVVVFYYIGHGTHGTVGGDPWPMMLLGDGSFQKLVPLKWVHEQLKSKGARLTATIGMCCNVYQQVARSSMPTFSVNYGGTYLTDTEKRSIQKMFLENKGDFLLSSASPGQSSVGGETVLGAMDFFTCVLVKLFEECASSGELEWNELFSEVKDYIHQATKGQQTPIFVANLSRSAAAPVPAPSNAPVTATPPAASQETASNDSEILNQLGLIFDRLIDVRQSEESRISQASTFERIFSENAIVKVLGQDSDMVVDKSTASDFIGRLATSRILLKVVPVNVVFSGNKIAELRVKEIYQK